jgi:hypothetical protein
VESLLNIPHLFDFGLFLFEPDDVVESRGTTIEAPRDNVIFELGLFMSRLGVKRAFAMAPRGRVKVLSDVAGLKLIEYDDPPGVADLRAKIAISRRRGARLTALVQSLQDKLRIALKPAIEEIRELLKQGPVEATGVFADAANVVQVGPVLVRLLRAALEISGAARVRHLALDMSEAWGILAHEILHGGGRIENVSWFCLMIDPDAPTIQDIASPSVSAQVAASRLPQMRQFLTDHKEHLARRNVVFECRLYAEPPMMHGFHIDNTAMLWSMCDIVQDKLEGSTTPYWRFEASDESVYSSHPARSFKNWFDYRWRRARRAWQA